MNGTAQHTLTLILISCDLCEALYCFPFSDLSDCEQAGFDMIVPDTVGTLSSDITYVLRQAKPSRCKACAAQTGKEKLST